MDAPDLRLLAVWNDCNLIAGGADDAPEPVFILGDAARNIIAASGQHATPMFLGLQDGAPIFAIDLSHGTESDATALATRSLSGPLTGPGEFVDLRSVGGLMPQQNGAILAFARGLAYWHRRHRYCGACGAATESRHGGHVRRCTDPACAIDHFPRTDPAVIMLVTAEFDGQAHCLLGRQATWAPGMYSSLAGFLETRGKL